MTRKERKFMAHRRPARPQLAALASACLLAAFACENPIRTAHDAAPGSDFSRYESYAWISSEPLIQPETRVVGDRYVSPIDEQRIRTAVDTELAAKGYRVTELEQADLVVSFAVGTQDKVRVDEIGGRDRTYYRGYGHGSWYGGSTVRMETYTEGTLALEFYDHTTKQAVWVGWASKRLSRSDEPGETIQTAVAMILEPFPARPGAAPGADD
jgi:hypothetical protein